MKIYQNIIHYVKLHLPFGCHGCAADVDSVSTVAGKFEIDVETAGNVIAVTATARAQQRACQHPAVQRSHCRSST